MFARLFSLLFILYFIATSLVMSVVAILLWAVTYPFDSRLRALHKLSCFWADLYIWAMPAWQVSISGREKIDKDEVYVIASNHQSLVDILAGFKLYVHFKWIAKAELFNAPFVGLVLRLNKYVKLKRESRQSIVEMMRAAQAHLENGSSVFIFPEGTRSKVPGVKPFKSGAFALAKRTRRPILPVALSGSRDALPKNSLVIRGRSQIGVYVLDPIPYEAFADKSTSEIAAMVRGQIAEAIGEPLVEDEG